MPVLSCGFIPCSSFFHLLIIDKLSHINIIHFNCQSYYLIYSFFTSSAKKPMCNNTLKASELSYLISKVSKNVFVVFCHYNTCLKAHRNMNQKLRLAKVLIIALTHRKPRAIKKTVTNLLRRAVRCFFLLSFSLLL